MTEIARLRIAVDATQLTQAERSMNSMRATAGRLAAALGAVVGVREIYQAAEAYTSLTSRLKLVTNSTAELAEAQEAVFKIAQSSRQPLEATAELYQRVAMNQKELKLTGIEMASVVGTISKTLAISGASAQSASAALTQLGQAFASGVLRGEELNSVMEQAPALAQAIARGMGVSVGKLRELGAAGALTAKATIDALQAQESAVEELFGKVSDTMDNGLTTVGNSFVQLVGKINETTGTSKDVAEAFISFSKVLDGFTSTSDATAQTVNILGAALGALGAGAAVLAANKVGMYVVASRAATAASVSAASATYNEARANEIAAQTVVHKAAIEAAAARGTAVQTTMSLQLASARMAEAAATSRAAAAQAALAATQRGSLAVLGGPVGLAMLAAAAAASYFLFSDSTEEVKRASIDLSQPLGELAEKWQMLDDAQKRVMSNNLTAQMQESAASIKDFGAEVEAAFYKRGNDGGLPVNDWIAPLTAFRDEIARGGKDIDVYAQALLDGVPAGDAFRILVEDASGKVAENAANVSKAAAALKALENQLNNTAAAQAGLNVETDKAGGTYLANLQKQLDFAGRLTEEQRTRIAIEKGYAGVLSESAQAQAIAVAKQIDSINAATRAASDGEKAKVKSAKADTSASDSINKSIAALQLQAMSYTQSAEDVEIYSLKQQGATEAQVSSARAALEQIDAMKAVRAAQAKAVSDSEQRMQIAGQVDPMIAERERFQEKLAQIRMLETEGVLSTQRGNELKLQAETAHAEQMRILQEENFRAQSYGNELLMASLDQLQQGATDAFVGILTGASNGQEAVQRLASAILNEAVGALVEMGIAQVKSIIMGQAAQTAATATSVAAGAATAAAWTPAAAAASIASFGGAAASGLAGMASAIPAMIGLLSFEGGGFTGTGSRSGGMDGKGGFMAMVHPNETIIDHTKGGKSGGGGGGVTIPISVNVSATDGMSAADAQRQGSVIAKQIEAQMMQVIAREQRPGGMLA